VNNNSGGITCSVSKAIPSGSKNRSQNNLELHELPKPTQSLILKKEVRKYCMCESIEQKRTNNTTNKVA
jgi:hypothetical protein